MATIKKYYRVSFDMKFGHEINAIATTKAEARRKAVERFLKKLKASDFNISVDEY